jgi:cytochrome c oxidase assembly factor CtaG
VLATVIQGGLLGALITWAPRTLYPRYDLTAPVWSLTGLEDQQLAGLIMWVPAGLVHLAAGLALVGLWIRGAGRRPGGGDRRQPLWHRAADDDRAPGRGRLRPR